MEFALTNKRVSAADVERVKKEQDVIDTCRPTTADSDLPVTLTSIPSSPSNAALEERRKHFFFFPLDRQKISNK